MLLVDACVGPSSIHNLGLIAKQRINKGQVIWQFKRGFDLLISPSELRLLSRFAREQVKHYGFLSNDTDCYILSSDDDRFTNHSLTPNSRFVAGRAFATRLVKPGQELTADYREFDASFPRRGI